MLGPGRLSETIAAAYGVPLKLPAGVSRMLMEAGLRTKSKRGRNAARVYARDAAAELISVAVCTHILHVARDFSSFANLPVLQVKSDVGDITHSYEHFEDKTWTERGLGLHPVNKLAEGHTLLDAVEALILAAANGTIGEHDRVFVDLHGPIPQAEIMVRTAAGSAVARYMAPLPKTSDEAKERFAALQREFGDGDLKTSKRFTDRSIRAVSVLIADGEAGDANA